MKIILSRLLIEPCRENNRRRDRALRWFLQINNFSSRYNLNLLFFKPFLLELNPFQNALTLVHCFTSLLLFSTHQFVCFGFRCWLKSYPNFCASQYKNTCIALRLAWPEYNFRSLLEASRSIAMLFVILNKEFYSKVSFLLSIYFLKK